MKQGSARRRPVRLTLVSAAAVTFMVSGSACALGEDDESIYCVDANQQVVPEEMCDDDDDGGSRHGYFLWKRKGKHKYLIGSKVAGGSLIRTDDPAARAKAGLASTGRVKSGTVSRGGFGGGSKSGTSGG